MRSRRTNRRELKTRIAALEAELAARTERDKSRSRPSPAVVPAVEKEEPPAPPIVHGGYPTRSSPRRPGSLKEAKEIWMAFRGR